MSKKLEQLNGDVQKIQNQININKIDLDKGMSLETSISELQELKIQKFSFKPSEFIPKSFLFLVHTDGDIGMRPLPENTGNSLSIYISQKQSISNVFKQGVNNEINCIVRNGGDLHVPIANVEILVSKPKEYNYEGEISSVRVLSESILVYAKRIKGKLKIGDSVKILKDGYAIHTVVEELEDNSIVIPFIQRPSRLPYVKLKVYGSLQASITVGDILVNDEENIFKNAINYQFIVEDVFTIVGRGTVLTGKVLNGYITLGSTLYYKDDTDNEIAITVKAIENSKKSNNVNTAKNGETVGLLVQTGNVKLKKGIKLTNTPKNGRNAILKNITPPKNINEYDCVDIITTSIAGHDTVIVTKELSIISGDNKSRFIAARVYSSIPVDLPNNFDSINPNIDRHTAVRMIRIE